MFTTVTIAYLFEPSAMKAPIKPLPLLNEHTKSDRQTVNLLINQDRLGDFLHDFVLAFHERLASAHALTHDLQINIIHLVLDIHARGILFAPRNHQVAILLGNVFNSLA